MIIKLLSIVFCLVITTSIVIAIDYCDPSLCRNRKHIACGNTGKISSECSDTAELLNLNFMKMKIVDLHNRYRNEVASGKVQHLRPASRMATMKWDDELAKMAEYNVKTCEFEHDNCRNTENYKYSGQNLAYFATTGTLNLESVILNAITSWYEENKDCNMSTINSYQRRRGKQIGHFTVMVNERNTAVGCSALKKEEDEYVVVLLACNYATNNILKKQIYTVGSPGSKCTNGKNQKYSSLCHAREPINPNNI